VNTSYGILDCDTCSGRHTIKETYCSFYSEDRSRTFFRNFGILLSDSKINILYCAAVHSIRNSDSGSKKFIQNLYGEVIRKIPSSYWLVSQEMGINLAIMI